MNNVKPVNAGHIFMMISACLIWACSAPRLRDSQTQVQGVVLNQDGKPIPNAVVRLHSPDGEREIHKAKSKRDGAFDIVSIPSKSLRLSVEAPGFSGLNTGNFWGVKEKIYRFSFKLPERKSLCEQHEGYGSIAGMVTDDLGEPLPGVIILLQGMGLSDTSWFDGAFKIDNIPSGLYDVSVKQLGFVEVTYNGVCIEPDSARKLNVVLSPIKVAQNIPERFIPID
jgi:hypothetical protein